MSYQSVMSQIASSLAVMDLFSTYITNSSTKLFSSLSQFIKEFT